MCVNRTVCEQLDQVICFTVIEVIAEVCIEFVKRELNLRPRCGTQFSRHRPIALFSISTGLRSVPRPSMVTSTGPLTF